MARVEAWMYGYKHRYKIDTDGNIFRVEHLSKDGHAILRAKKMETEPHSGHGALYVRINENKKVKRFHVAKLVLKTFLKVTLKPEKEKILWKDGNKNNNALSNLTIISVKESLRLAKERREVFYENIIEMTPKVVKGVARLSDGHHYTIDLTREVIR